MTTIAETVQRWRALDPDARRRLLVHLARLLALLAAGYAVAAVVFQSWWSPAVVIALTALLSSLFQRLQPSPRVLPAAHDRGTRAVAPPASLAQHLLSVVVVAVVAGVLIGIIDNDVQSGAEYGAVVAAVLAGLVLVRRQTNR